MNPLLSLTVLVTPLTMAQIRAVMVKALVAMRVRADLWIAGTCPCRRYRLALYDWL